MKKAISLILAFIITISFFMLNSSVAFSENETNSSEGKTCFNDDIGKHQYNANNNTGGSGYDYNSKYKAYIDFESDMLVLNNNKTNESKAVVKNSSALTCFFLDENYLYYSQFDGSDAYIYRCDMEVNNTETVLTYKFNGVLNYGESVDPAYYQQESDISRFSFIPADSKIIVNIMDIDTIEIGETYGTYCVFAFDLNTGKKTIMDESTSSVSSYIRPLSIYTVGNNAYYIRNDMLVIADINSNNKIKEVSISGFSKNFETNIFLAGAQRNILYIYGEDESSYDKYKVICFDTSTMETSTLLSNYMSDPIHSIIVYNNFVYLATGTGDGCGFTIVQNYSSKDVDVNDENTVLADGNVLHFFDNSIVGLFADPLTCKYCEYKIIANLSETELSVNVDFTITNDGEKVKGTTELKFDTSMIENDSSIYNHDLSRLCSQFVTLGYDNIVKDSKKTTGHEYTSTALQTAFSGLNFNNPEINLQTGRDEMNYFIAQKDVTIDGKIYHVILTGFIGSYYHQWESDFDPNGKGREDNNKKGYAGTDGMGSVHLGFADAAAYMKKALEAYLKKNESQYETKLIVTGHSRGAAAANLFSSDIIKTGKLGSFTIKKENLYTYTFATPNVAKISAADKKNSDLNRIFNIVNPEDFVTRVLPSEWNFGKYGTTYTLPSKSNDGLLYYVELYNMNNYFRKLSQGNEYYPYKFGTYSVNSVMRSMTMQCHNLDGFYGFPHYIDGILLTPYQYFETALVPICVSPKKTDEDKLKEKEGLALLISSTVPSPFLTSPIYQKLSSFFVIGEGISGYFSNAHKAETYCAYLLSLSEYDLTYRKQCASNEVRCPVDIEIYLKSTGELVGAIYNNQVDESIASDERSLVIGVDGDRKFFDIPNNDDYEVKLIGNGEGTMDYTVSTCDGVYGTIDSANYYDIPVTQNKTFTVNFHSDSENLKNMQLTDENGVIPMDCYYTTEDADNIPSIEIKVSSVGNGNVSEDIIARPGDYVTVCAYANEGDTFEGWYENDKQVCDTEIYEFSAKTERTLVAKFTGETPKQEENNKKTILIIIIVSAIALTAVAIVLIFVLRKKTIQNKKTI